ncbi:MAG: hypothetical protein Q9218_007343 [Villophora microphyllina]
MPASLQPQPVSSSGSGNSTTSGGTYNATTDVNGTITGNDTSTYTPNTNDTSSAGTGSLETIPSNSTGTYNDTTSSTGTYNDTTSSTSTNNTDLESGIYPLSNTTSDTNSTSNESTSTSTDSTAEMPLMVSEMQYTINGNQRVEISLSYGDSNITQIWEAREGMLSLVPTPANETGEEGPTATLHAGPYTPMGTGGVPIGGSGNDTNSTYYGGDTGNGTSGGMGMGMGGTGTTSPSISPTTTPTSTPTSSGGAGMGYQVNTGVAGTSGRAVPVANLDRPDVNHPGFTGPKAKLKAKRFVNGLRE